jgi:hypothetical protein
MTEQTPGGHINMQQGASLHDRWYTSSAGLFEGPTLRILPLVNTFLLQATDVIIILFATRRGPLS